MSNFPPPPPKRNSLLAGPSSPTAKGAIWNKTKEYSKAAWDGGYKLADKVGYWTNKQTAKIGIESFYPTSLDLECTKAARILRTFSLADGLGQDTSFNDRKKTQKIIKKIPPSAIANCQGLAIYTVCRSGFAMFSGAGGSGIVIARQDDGSWSAPSGILIHTLGFGFLLGVDVYDVVLLLRTKKAVETFIKPRVTLGGEVSVAAGPVGNGAKIESGVEASPVWSYVKSKGFYAGVQMDGNIIIERKDENARCYHEGVKASEILAGEVDPPYWTEGLLQMIKVAEGKETATDKIPMGLTPAEMMEEHYARKLPQEDEDSDDERDRREMEERMREFGIEDPEINRKRQSLDTEMIRSPSPSLLKTFSQEQLEVISDDPPNLDRKTSAFDSDYDSSQETGSVYKDISLDEANSPELHFASNFPSSSQPVSPPPYLDEITPERPSTPPVDSHQSDEKTPSKSDSTHTHTHAPPPVIPARRRVPPLPSSKRDSSVDLIRPSTPQTPVESEPPVNDSA